MAKVELKQPVVEEISAGIKDAQSVVLVDYRGLTVEQDTQLRKSLREAGVSYKVYKNTMMNFAFKGTQFEGLSEYLEGPSAMAYSTEDATAPARVLAQFAKTADKLDKKLDRPRNTWKAIFQYHGLIWTNIWGFEFIANYGKENQCRRQPVSLNDRIIEDRDSEQFLIPNELFERYFMQEMVPMIKFRAWDKESEIYLYNVQDCEKEEVTDDEL